MTSSLTPSLELWKSDLFLEVFLSISAVLFLIFCLSTHPLEHKVLFLFTKRIEIDINSHIFFSNGKNW